MRVSVLTTSFPLEPESPSGIFVARLFDHLPDDIDATIIAPASRRTAGQVMRGRLHVTAVRYAPARWRLLAHEPGGLPVALRTRPWLHAIVPMLLASLAAVTWRQARHSDVIHANWAVNGLLAGLVGRLCGRPLIVTLRGEDVTRARRRRLSRWLLGATLRLSTRAAAVSSDMADWLRAQFPDQAGKIVLVENGVDDEFFTIGRPAEAPGTREWRLVTVGSLIPRKGVDTLIRALAALEAGPWHLRVVGAGGEQPGLARLAEDLGVSSRITFAGNVPPDQVRTALAAADAFLLASHAEGRPNALLEAMAAGLPVIASRIDGVTELVEEGISGLLADPGDVPAWIQALRRLHQDPALGGRLGEAARRQIQGRGLTWDGAARAYARHYQAMAER